MDKKSSKVLLIMFLAGIFMGSLDTAIISPARTVMEIPYIFLLMLVYG